MTQDHADRQSWQVVDTAEDLDVSASTAPPFDRPALGPWLREPRCHEWDALVFWRADRAVRSMADMFALTRWAQEHRKVVVFVSGPFGGDPLTLDLRHDKADPHVNLILAIIAFAAEVESQAIKERVNGARAFLLPTDRWTGGLPGYGYRIVDHPVRGKTIEVDPYAAGVIREIAQRLCDGEAVSAIAQSFNQRGELTTRDHVEWETILLVGDVEFHQTLEGPYPDHQMRVSARPSTGYAALSYTDHTDPDMPIANSYNPLRPLPNVYLVFNGETGSVLPRAALISIADAGSALNEWLQTRQRPTCIEWRPYDFY